MIPHQYCHVLCPLHIRLSPDFAALLSIKILSYVHLVGTRFLKPYENFAFGVFVVIALRVQWHAGEHCRLHVPTKESSRSLAISRKCFHLLLTNQANGVLQPIKKKKLN